MATVTPTPIADSALSNLPQGQAGTFAPSFQVQQAALTQPVTQPVTAASANQTSPQVVSTAAPAISEVNKAKDTMTTAQTDMASQAQLKAATVANQATVTAANEANNVTMTNAKGEKVTVPKDLVDQYMVSGYSLGETYSPPPTQPAKPAPTVAPTDKEKTAASVLKKYPELNKAAVPTTGMISFRYSNEAPGHFMHTVDASTEVGQEILKSSGIEIEPSATATSATAAAPTAQEQLAGTNAEIQQNQAQLDDAFNTFNGAMQQFQTGTFPLTATQQAQISATQQSFENLIKQQELFNKNYEAGVTAEGISRGINRYAPLIAMGEIQKAVSDGLTKVANINAQMTKTIADLEEGFQDKNFDRVKTAYDEYHNYMKEKNDTLQHMADKTQEQMNFAQTEADKMRDFEYQKKKDELERKRTKSVDFYNQVTQPIQNIAEEAAKNGADAKTLESINGAQTVQDALNAAGDSLQSATGQLGDYLQYKRETVGKGLVPEDYSTWRTKDDARKAKEKASEAYSSAYNAAAGRLAAEKKYSPDTIDNVATNQVENSSAITVAAGLSLNAFNFLTQGTAALSRLPAEQRNKITNEAQSWLNNNGIDVSTFKSQYKAYNDVLEKNLARANQTQIMAGEVTASADSLIEAIDQKDLGKFRSANLVKLMVGEEVNDPTTMKYSTQLRFMANDLAGYLAAARGAASPELQDQRDAAELITTGLNKKSVQAFKDSVIANEQKVTKVVGGAVNNAQKQVWGLFGVGDKFTPKISDEEAKKNVNSWVTSGGDTAEQHRRAVMASNAYKVPGVTEADVWEYLKNAK